MPAVGADDVVVVAQRVNGAHGDGLLAYREVRAASEELLGEHHVADLLLEEPDPQQVLVEMEQLVAVFLLSGHAYPSRQFSTTVEGVCVRSSRI